MRLLEIGEYYSVLDLLRVIHNVSFVLCSHYVSSFHLHTIRLYFADESINSYQDEAVYCLLKKASNPTNLGGLDIDLAIVGQTGVTCLSDSKKASLLDVFSDKCVRSNEVSFLKNKADSFIRDRTMSLLSGATVLSYLDLQRQQRGEEDSDNDSLHVGQVELLPRFKSGFHSGLNMPKASDYPADRSSDILFGFKGLGEKEAKKAFIYPMAAALLLLLLKVFFILSRARSCSLKAKKKKCKNRVKNRVSKRLLYSFMRISALFISLGRVVVSDITAADIEQVCTCCYHCTSCYHSHSFDCYNLTHLYSSTFRLEMMLL